MRIVWLLCLVACISEDDPIGDRSGTAVGNPGDLDVSTRLQSDELTADLVWVPVGGVALELCSGGALPLPVDTVLDGLFPSFQPVALPAGQFCGAVVELSDPVTVEGATTAGTAFLVELDLQVLSLDGAFTVDGQTLLVDLPLPLEAAVLDALGPDAVVLADTPQAATWAEQTRADTLLAIDEDGSGGIEPGERVVATTADPPPGMAASLQDAGCGCAQGSGAPVASLWVLALLGVRRRRLSDVFGGTSG